MLEQLMREVQARQEEAQNDSAECGRKDMQSYYNGKYEAYLYVEQILRRAIKEIEGR